MGWDEWEQTKADVAARSETRMQVNSAAGPAGPPDLKTNAHGKGGAMKALAELIQPGVDKAGVHADEPTDAAERAFSGWATGSGLTDAHEEWARQVQNLKVRLAGDQAALSNTRRDFQYVDHGVYSGLSGIDVPTPGPRRDA
ncbi:hypothetical protein [Streptomyces sp. NPDC000410]|uniref:hypothetical protein n=1 Tax=Streptomyces sp. NPDC000410 TaxID=3154254 RepID=UPI00331AD905